jgi:hypothetical protein
MEKIFKKFRVNFDVGQSAASVRDVLLAPAAIWRASCESTSMQGLIDVQTYPCSDRRIGTVKPGRRIRSCIGESGDCEADGINSYDTLFQLRR